MKSKFTKRAMAMDDFKDSLWYRVACYCNDPKCDANINFEYDKRLNTLFLNFYKNVIVCEPYCYNENIIDKLERYWRRFCKSIKLLFTGYLEMEESFILQDTDHINNFIEVLEEGRDLLLERYEQKDKKAT